MKFPIYRKYANDRHFFKVIDDRRFEEVRRIGSRATVTMVTAGKFPEIQFIQDLIAGSNALPITEEEYERYRSMA